MKVWNLPLRPRGFLFDMDSTLYTNEAFARAQIDGQIARLAQEKGLPPAAMAAEIDSWRRSWSASHAGQTISLGNTFLAFGVDMATSIRWREELIDPAGFLERDPRLARALEALRTRGPLAVVTNNPVAVAGRILETLGVAELFDEVIGLDTCMKSKPHRDIFLGACARIGRKPDECVSIGDRYDIDLALPIELGMGGILVEDVSEVHSLDATLALCNAGIS